MTIDSLEIVLTDAITRAHGTGWDLGYDAAKAEAKADRLEAYSEGARESYADAYTDGYDDGHNEGRNEGVLAATKGEPSRRPKSFQPEATKTEDQ